MDDAFITWRFGKNFALHGIWNFNPSHLDPTQAYTNPIFALTSLIPHLNNVDVVLFFKSFSLLTLGAFTIWFLVVTKKSFFMLLLVLALPATAIHAFGGLETFFFIFLVSALLVSLDRNQTKISIILTLILLFTRPEAWVLVGLVPLYLSTDCPRSTTMISWRDLYTNIKNIRIAKKKLLVILFFLTAPLFFYFLFHQRNFGSFLPNTFYAKSGAIFLFKELVKYSLFLIPVLSLLLLGRIKILIFIFVFFGIMALGYSKSFLTMNYASRFAYHIFMPVCCFMIYIAASQRGKIMELIISSERIARCKVENFIKFLATVALCIFLSNSGVRPIGLYTYYPRLLTSHGQLGDVLAQISDKYRMKSFAIGDAGLAPYRSDLNVLDIVGLGSSLVVKNGLTDQVLSTYAIDLVAFYASAESIQTNLFAQDVLHKLARENDFFRQCDVYWRPDYTLRLYEKQQVPELQKLCQNSDRLNNMPDEKYFKEIMFIPPWRYWRT